MVLVFLPLFMGVGYADSQGITLDQAEDLFDKFFSNQTDDEYGLTMNIFEILQSNWIKVSADLFINIAKSDKEITTLKGLIPELESNTNLENNISEEIALNKSFQVSDEDLDSDDSEVVFSITEEEIKEIEASWKRADEAWKRADAYDKLWKTLDVLSSELKKL